MINNLKERENSRNRYIKNIILSEVSKKWLTQKEVSEKIWVNLNTLKQYIWGPRNKTDDKYYDLIFKEILWYDEDKINKIKLNALKYQMNEEVRWIYGNNQVEFIMKDNKNNEEEITEEQINELKENFMNEMALSRKFRNDYEALEEARKIWEFMVDEAVKIKKLKNR